MKTYKINIAEYKCYCREYFEYTGEYLYLTNRAAMGEAWFG